MNKYFRMKLLSCVDRAINPESYMNEVVYDLDQLSSAGPSTDTTAQKRYAFLYKMQFGFIYLSKLISQLI